MLGRVLSFISNSLLFFFSRKFNAKNQQQQEIIRSRISGVGTELDKRREVCFSSLHNTSILAGDDLYGGSHVNRNLSSICVVLVGLTSLPLCLPGINLTVRFATASSALFIVIVT